VLARAWGFESLLRHYFNIKITLTLQVILDSTKSSRDEKPVLSAVEGPVLSRVEGSCFFGTRNKGDTNRSPFPFIRPSFPIIP